MAILRNIAFVALFSGLAIVPGSATTVVQFAAPAMSNPAVSLPPPSPSNEISTQPAPVLARSCKDVFAAHFRKNDYTFASPNFSRSAKWGLVVRLDFERVGAPPDPAHFHRLVCFIREGEWGLNAGVYDGTLKDPAKRLPVSGQML